MHYHSDLIIWQVFFDSFQKNIVLELRQAQTGEISFLTFFFDENTQNFQYQTHEKEQNPKEQNDNTKKPLFWTMPERFWLAPRKLQNSLFFVQHYPNDTKPELMGIWVLDIMTHNVLWQEPLAKFVTIEKTEIRYKIHEKEFTQPIFEQHEIPHLPKNELTTLFPEYYTQDLSDINKNYFDIVKDFLQQHFPNDVPLYELAYLETENFLYIGYFCSNEQTKENTVNYCIFDKEKNAFISKKTYQNDTIGYVCFWVYADFWVYISDRNHISIEKIAF